MILVHRGNQIVHVKVAIPTKLTEKQRKLIEEFAEESKEASGSGASHTKKKATEHRSILNEAWKRVKDFLHHSEKADSKDKVKDQNGKEEEKENVKAKI